MMLSENTEEGLIISFLSMVTLVREVLEESAAYVLEKRVNQDPFEAYFGQQRSKTLQQKSNCAVIRQQYKNFRRCKAQH